MRTLRLLTVLLGELLVLAVVLAVGVLAGLNTDPGRRLAERAIAWASSGQVTITGLAGSFPTALRAARIEVADAGGVWLTVEDAALNTEPERLLAGEARIDDLTAARLTIARLPIASAAPGGGVGDLPVRLVLRRLRVDRLEIAAVALSVAGSAQLSSWRDGRARLTVEGLNRAGPGLRRLTVRVRGQAGTMRLEAVAEGVRLPGPTPLLLAAAPLRLTAEAAPGRPVTFALSHPLVGIEGTADLADSPSAEAAITLPDLAPLVAAAGMVLQGRAALRLKAAPAAGGTRLDVDGTLAVNGGMAPLPALLGPDATISLSAVLHGAGATLSRLRLDGRALSVAAQGDLRGEAVALDWRLGLPDLTTLAAAVAGSLTARGQASGPIGDLAFTADLSGDLAGAPLSLDMRASRGAGGALHLEIARADWRASHADATLDLPPGAALPLGTMTVKMDDLSDFSRFAGQRLSGSVAATLRTSLEDGTPLAQLDLQAREVGLPGRATVGEASLAARVRDPLGSPVAEARLAASGLHAGGIGGGVQIDATGPVAALALRLNAALIGLAGAPLSAQAAATLDLPGRTLALRDATAGWRGETLRLLAPMRVAFGDGVAVDQARFGVGDAVLAVAGRLTPTLDLTASLRDLTAGLVRVVVPGLQADGRLDGEVRLSGTPGRPTGTIRLAATGIRPRGNAAAGLPVGALTADATLDGTSARLAAALSAGANRLTLSGKVPLAASGAMDLRAAGSVDLAVLDPILGAGGTRVGGRLTLEAGITGTIAAPHAAGMIRVAGGEVQDFALGARLSHVEALVQADGDTLHLARFSARAGKGSISASGSVGLAAPMPVDLSMTMHDASPLTSDRLTAVLDSVLTLRGAAMGRMEAAGKVTIQRADIRIPEKMPARVAVLDVRRPGQPPPAPARPPDIGLDVTLATSGRVFVRGRGVDAELAGQVHLGGSIAAPRPSGGFTLRRGRLALAGASLDFSRGAVGFGGGGPIDPTLDFLASSTSGSTVADLAITGYANAPKITLSSTPEMPPDEVLAWLLFHQGATTLNALQLVQIAQALAQVSGLDRGFDPLEALRSGLGLDRLSVDGGKDMAVEAGRYVAPGVYVGARQGTAGSGTQGLMQIDLAKGLKLETTVGTDQNATGAGASAQDAGTSVGLSYQFEY